MRRPGRQVAVVALVGLAMLAPIDLPTAQDSTRISLTRSIVLHGSLEIPQHELDRAVYNRRSYSDKAPGMAFLAVPAVEAERAVGKARPPSEWRMEADLTLWFVRVATGGLFFLLAVWLVGRGNELFEPGTGVASAAIFGTATLAAPLAPTLFEHVGAGALGFASFLLVRRPTRRNALLAGLLGGLAVLVEYQAILFLVAVIAVAALRERRRILEVVLGAAPPLLLLGLYDQLAFGSPFHLSYRYVANQFAGEQHTGFFGVGFPSASGLREVLVGHQGLLVLSPVLAMAAAGLMLLWRHGHRIEAAVAASVSAAFVVYDAGYFLPYGGASPGPRFLAPALPFVALGLGPALRRWPLTTLAVGAVSVVLTLGNVLTWSVRRDTGFLPQHPMADLVATVWSWYGLNRIPAAGLVALAAVAAFALGAASLRQRP